MYQPQPGLAASTQHCIYAATWITCGLGRKGFRKGCLEQENGKGFSLNVFIVTHGPVHRVPKALPPQQLIRVKTHTQKIQSKCLSQAFLHNEHPLLQRLPGTGMTWTKQAASSSQVRGGRGRGRGRQAPHSQSGWSRGSNIHLFHPKPSPNFEKGIRKLTSPRWELHFVPTVKERRRHTQAHRCYGNHSSEGGLAQVSSPPQAQRHPNPPGPHCWGKMGGQGSRRLCGGGQCWC